MKHQHKQPTKGGAATCGEGNGKFYGYVRVSTDKQATDGVSLKEQEHRLRGYAASIGMEVAEIVVEAGVSGSKSLAKRPKGSTLLKKVDRGDQIAVVKLDRFSRSASDALNVVEQLTKQGVTLHCLDIGGAVNADGVGKLVFSILAAVAEMERSRIAERVRDAKTFMRQGGYFTGGKLAAGYKVKNGKMVADNEWNTALTAMRLWRVEQMPYRSIAEKVKETFGITLDYSTCFRILNNKRLLDAA